MENPSTEKVNETIDLEDCAKKGHHPPYALHYRIKINTDYYIVHLSEMLGRQLLELNNKLPPERFRLFEVICGKKEPVGLDAVVHFVRKGLECFVSLPLDQTDGEA